MISEVSFRDPELAQRYRTLAADSIAHHGGRYLVRGARPLAVEGRWPDDERAVIVRFPSMDAARAWYRSADYAEALAIRPDALERRLLFVEGTDESEERLGGTASQARPRSVG